MAEGQPDLTGLDRVAADGVPRRALIVTWILVGLFVAVGELGELFALDVRAEAHDLAGPHLQLDLAQGLVAVGRVHLVGILVAAAQVAG